MVMSLAPFASASMRSSPVPTDIASSGSLLPSGTRVSPDADAISITALPSSKTAYRASTWSIKGPCTVTVTAFASEEASTASTVPSPPSASGMLTVSTSPNTSRAAAPSSSAVREESRLPLNESLANTSFIFQLTTLTGLPSAHARILSAVMSIILCLASFAAQDI